MDEGIPKIFFIIAAVAIIGLAAFFFFAFVDIDQGETETETGERPGISSRISGERKFSFPSPPTSDERSEEQRGIGEEPNFSVEKIPPSSPPTSFTISPVDNTKVSDEFVSDSAPSSSEKPADTQKTVSFAPPPFLPFSPPPVSPLFVPPPPDSVATASSIVDDADLFEEPYKQYIGQPAPQEGPFVVENFSEPRTLEEMEEFFWSALETQLREDGRSDAEIAEVREFVRQEYARFAEVGIEGWFAP